MQKFSAGRDISFKTKYEEMKDEEKLLFMES